MKNILLIITLALLPSASFSQLPPTPPAPAASAPIPPIPPISPSRDREDRGPKVPVTFLGVETSEIPSVLCDQLGMAKGFGLVVDYVTPEGPAASAGVQQNDILKMLNDQILTDPNQLGKLIRSYQEGTTVTFTLMRKGQEQKVTVKLGKKEVPKRSLERMHMGHNGDLGWNFNFEGFDGDQLREQMAQLKEKLGDQEHGMIHDVVARARAEAQRARDEARRTGEEVRNQMHVLSRDNGALKSTTIDLNGAQIVFSDDKGELRVQKNEGKKFLTAKDSQGKLIFSGPVETPEEIAKIPAEVRERFEKLQKRDLPAMAPNDLRANGEAEEDEEDDDDNPRASSVSYEQVCGRSYRNRSFHTTLS